MHEDDQHSPLAVAPTSLQTSWQQFFQLRDPALRKQLIEHYLAFARTIAAKFYRLRIDDSVSFDDYLQYARTGLIEAVDCFNPTLAVAFESFSAHRIRGSILNGLSAESELAAQRKAGLPTGIYERLQSFEALQSNGAEDDALHHWAEKVVGLAIGLMLDRADEEIIDESIQSNPYARVELLYLRRRILRCLELIPARAREVIELHYFEHMEFQFVAEKLSISKGRVSQLHARGLHHLRSILGSEGRLDASL